MTETDTTYSDEMRTILADTADQHDLNADISRYTSVEAVPGDKLEMFHVQIETDEATLGFDVPDTSDPAMYQDGYQPTDDEIMELFISYTSELYSAVLQTIDRQDSSDDE